VGDRIVDELSILTPSELESYRTALEGRLAQAELPWGSLPREELEAQLVTVRAELAGRGPVGSADAHP
jgi:hypothetical protein